MNKLKGMQSGRHRVKSRVVTVCIVLTIFIVYQFCPKLDIVPVKYLHHVKQGTDNNESYFVLQEVHRHGVGKYYKHHQTLEISETVAAQANLLFQMQEAQLMKESHDGETLWSTNPRYRTTDPFSYKFKISQDSKAVPRMKNRDPTYLEFLASDVGRQVIPEWIDEFIRVPNITDKDSVIGLALMSSNAYVGVPHTGDWRNVTQPWDHKETDGFGWDGEGLRGHIFYNRKDDIVVISIKGTSAQGIPGAGDDETTTNDKLNDNLLFSCCCARVSYLWNTVCDCYIKSNTCDESCLEKEIRQKDRYYQAVIDIYADVIVRYPTATVWMTGHSLGGALAALVGRTFGLPVVTFEAPGELLAAKRLHLPFPPGLPQYQDTVWNFGHSADPIFLGTCNGASSSCSIAGYAMETSCHSGQVCVYDVVKDKGWHVNMFNHRIHTVIDQILVVYNETAECVVPEPCVDCYNWDFWPDRNHKKITTTEVSTTTAEHSTSVCIGRNWLGICTAWATVPDTEISSETAIPSATKADIRMNTLTRHS
ncbi:similar to Saccharomyces cerevisiae YCR068W ATG15 Lipase required for intravacuolar lysis of autophagic bodies and Cvt bodies [Maudiozyma saulgeensis]|uniref:Putative lipase ATG15 n=1 Tax=Maudiozyma saulgeensis TaxID=1789683 RepID=A0A1X7R5X0_9SACH|nr:similar to Saccharomyces cerevisiae YCR068W ATG15 Lipase required for intravacuolar lysis of autophagic bodies and Cvt bodies [Kazachstania saulgeensis]